MSSVSCEASWSAAALCRFSDNREFLRSSTHPLIRWCFTFHIFRFTHLLRRSPTKADHPPVAPQLSEGGSRLKFSPYGIRHSFVIRLPRRSRTKAGHPSFVIF